jgi:hypothetical protein
MPTDRIHAQYMPISIGLLIEPSFLRRAVDDASDRHTVTEDSLPQTSPAHTGRIRGALDQVAALFYPGPATRVATVPLTATDAADHLRTDLAAAPKA